MCVIIEEVVLNRNVELMWYYSRKGGGGGVGSHE